MLPPKNERRCPYICKLVLGSWNTNCIGQQNAWVQDTTNLGEKKKKVMKSRRNLRNRKIRKIVCFFFFHSVLLREMQDWNIAWLTERRDKRARDRVDHHNGKDHQHPGVLLTKRKLTHSFLLNEVRCHASKKNYCKNRGWGQQLGNHAKGMAWPTDQPTDWPIGRLTGRLADRLADVLTNWPTH